MNYGVDVDRYSNDEIVDKFEDRLEKILSFGLNAALPAIITAASALLSAIVLKKGGINPNPKELALLVLYGIVFHVEKS